MLPALTLESELEDIMRPDLKDAAFDTAWAAVTVASMQDVTSGINEMTTDTLAIPTDGSDVEHEARGADQVSPTPTAQSQVGGDRSSQFYAEPQFDLMVDGDQAGPGDVQPEFRLPDMRNGPKVGRRASDGLQSTPEDCVAGGGDPKRFKMQDAAGTAQRFLRYESSPIGVSQVLTSLAF
jgi:hypothetical protein